MDEKREIKKVKKIGLYIAKSIYEIPLGVVLSTDKNVASAFFDGKYGIGNIRDIEGIIINDLDFTCMPFYQLIETEEFDRRYYEDSSYDSKRDYSDKIRLIKER